MLNPKSIVIFKMIATVFAFTYFTTLTIFAIFAIFVYGIVVSAGLVRVVIQAPRLMSQSWFVQTYGFLALSIRPDRLYWSVVIFVRKSLLLRQ